MDLAAILRVFYKRTADQTDPPQNDSDDVIGWLNEAVSEACVRARLLFDNQTADIVSYDVAANTPEIPVDPRIDTIAAAFFTPVGGVEKQLDLVGLDWIEDRIRSLPASASYFLIHCSRPDALAVLLNNRVRLWPTSTPGGVLRLEVWRQPLEALADDADEPEIAEIHHLGLIDWMEYRCYQQRDSEFYDDRRAATSLTAFEARFGKRRSASALRQHKERRRTTTRCI